VNELSQLMRDTVAHPPHDDRDLAAVLRTGRRRVRRRRAGFLGGTALATAAVVAIGALAWPESPPDFAAAGVPRPDAPTLHLTDARSAVEGQDYRVLASYTNDDLDADNGQYFDGVTDDGLILFRDGPRMAQRQPRFALMDPATGDKDWLPDLDIGQTQTRALELGEDRLVLLGAASDGLKAHLVTYTFDRELRQWSGMKWRDLPAVANPFGAVLGPDNRLYVPVPATQGTPPPGGWPTGPDGEADDADVDGDTYRLWSASLSDGADVRDEGITVGSLAFADHSMVWTDSTNGDAGLIHVRDLTSGEEHSFDPHSGDRCNLLSFGASDNRIVMGQYCGTYDDGVRDDRVQVLTTKGDQIATVQGSGIEGSLTTTGGEGVVTVSSYESGGGGTYVYDLGSDRFLQISNDISSWGMGGPTPDDTFFWHTPVNRGHGSTQHLGELVD
jgi:hypothetical protein